MNTPRILILTASVGAGHNRAAQAIELALGELCPNAALHYVDVLDLTNATVRKFYGKTYFDVVAAAPHLVGYLYDRLDRPPGVLDAALDKMRFGLQHLNFGALNRLLTEQPWDLAINTHFLPAEVIAAFRRAGRTHFPQVTVTTDFDTHRLWHNAPCEHYFTATEEARANLSAWGVPMDAITATGIPVHPFFTRPVNRLDYQRALGLSDDRPVVLQLAGGLGVGPIEKIHRQLLDIEPAIQLVVVTGRNTVAREKLAAIGAPSRHRRMILGFTDRMDQLMGAADVIVSKPGGLTTSESLCRSAAMVIVDPIPGQESRNSDFLLENGAAVKVNNVASLGHKLTALLAEPGRLQSMRAAALSLARPRAAYDVAKAALQFVDSPTLPPADPIKARSKMMRLWRGNKREAMTRRRRLHARSSRAGS